MRTVAPGISIYSTQVHRCPLIVPIRQLINKCQRSNQHSINSLLLSCLPKLKTYMAKSTNHNLFLLEEIVRRVYTYSYLYHINQCGHNISSDEPVEITFYARVRILDLAECAQGLNQKRDYHSNTIKRSAKPISLAPKWIETLRNVFKFSAAKGACRGVDGYLKTPMWAWKPWCTKQAKL